MAQHEIAMSFSNLDSRDGVRIRVANVVASEAPGIGSDDSALKYICFVKTLRLGDRVYLQYPANLYHSIYAQVHGRYVSDKNDAFCFQKQLAYDIRRMSRQR